MLPYFLRTNNCSRLAIDIFLVYPRKPQLLTNRSFSLILGKMFPFQIDSFFKVSSLGSLQINQTASAICSNAVTTG